MFRSSHIAAPKPSHIWLVTVVAGLAAALPVAPGFAQLPQSSGHHLIVENRSGSPLTAVVASGYAGSQTNLLGPSSVAPGTSRLMTLQSPPAACTFDLRATFANGKTLLSSGFNICTSPTWAVTDTPKLLPALPSHPEIGAIAPHAPLLPGAPVPAPPPAPVHHEMHVMPPAPVAAAPAPALAPPPPPAPAPRPSDTATVAAGPPEAPIHVHQAAPAPPPVHHAAPAPSDGQAEAAQFAATPEGHALYDVPHQMSVGIPYTATATLYAPAATAIPGAAHTLKVSTYMIVTLTEPDNPGAFSIESQQGPCQFIPDAGLAQWNFKITPVAVNGSRIFSLRSTDKLTFTSYIAYGSAKDACAPTNVLRHQLPVDSETVMISALDPNSLWDRSLDFVSNNPGKALATVLGGGFGIPGIVSAIKWAAGRWRRRKRPTAPATPDAKPTGA